jgi:hypothetical protein
MLRGMKNPKLNLLAGLYFLLEGIVSLVRSLEWYRLEKAAQALGVPVPHPTDFWGPALSFLIAAGFLWSAWTSRHLYVPGSDRYYPGTKAILSFAAAAAATGGAYFYGDLLWKQYLENGLEAIFPGILWVGFWGAAATYALWEGRKWWKAWRKSRLDPTEELLTLR